MPSSRDKKKIINSKPIKMSQNAMPMPTPHLPEEITMDILSRLPVKSLLRFRCVSKPWLNLISNPQFVKLHLNRSIALKNQRLLLSTFPLQSIDYCEDNAIIELDCPIRNPDFNISIEGCCDGLLCLFDEEYISVYNPSTRKFRELPLAPEIEDASPASDMFYGFGYDSSVDDYKVFGGRRTNSGDTKFVEFNLKDNFWRISRIILGNIFWIWRKGVVFVNGALHREGGVFVNGALHWLGTRQTGTDNVTVVVSLDLTRERFEEIPLPDHDELESSIMGFGVLGDCLYVLLDYDGIFVEVWEMREYGVKASWEKLVTLPLEIGDDFIEHLTPLCFVGNGELLLEINGGQLVLYNAEENAFRNVTIRGDPDWFAAALCLGSLVPPNGL